MEDKYKTAREKGLLWLRWSMVLATLGYSWLALVDIDLRLSIRSSQ